MEDRTFTCAHCGGTFIKATTDEEQRAESLALYGELAPEDQAVICHDCFLAFEEWRRTVEAGRQH